MRISLCSVSWSVWITVHLSVLSGWPIIYYTALDHPHMHSLIGLAMGNLMHLSEPSDIHLSEIASCTIHQQCHMNHVACVLYVWELTHQWYMQHYEHWGIKPDSCFGSPSGWDMYINANFILTYAQYSFSFTSCSTITPLMTLSPDAPPWTMHKAPMLLASL